MSVLLNKHNFAVAQFAATEESRYTLKAIQVNQHATVATNGHYLVRVSNPTTDPNSFPLIQGLRNGGPFKDFLLPVDVAKEIEKALPKGKRCNIPVLANAMVSHYVDGEESKPNIGVTDLDSPKVFTPRTITGQFPNWQAVIPTRAPKLEIYVDANYLAQLASAAAKFMTDNNTQPLRLQFTDANSPVRLDARNTETGQGWTALLMPMRGDKKSCHGAGNVPDVEVKSVDAFAMVNTDGTFDELYQQRIKLQEIRQIATRIKLPA